MDELNHRVKNIADRSVSLATNSLRRTMSLDGFQQVFLRQIHALTAAYALPSRDGWSLIPRGPNGWRSDGSRGMDLP